MADSTAADVRRRAAAGAVMVALRGMGVRVFGLIGNVVLARLLVPEDFGLIAVALTITFFASNVADAGLGAGLIGRSSPPTREELRSVAGFQLLMTIAFTLITGAASLALGRTGLIATVMVSSLILTVFRTPGALVLERDLRYGPLVVIEVAETLAFNAFAIAAVALGAGVWGMAAALLFRAAVGAVAMVAMSPVGLILPSARLSPIKPLLAFGSRFQAVGFALIARGLGLNAGVAAIGGLRLLGLWAIADRFLSVLALITESLWRVSFPMLSRLMESGEDVRALLARNVALVTFAVGLLGCLLVGAGPALMPSLLGHAYAGAAVVLPPACLALVLTVPVTTVIGGYLYAQGRAGAVLAPVVAQSLVWFAVTFPLLPLIGLMAVGVGSMIGAAVGSAMLVRAAHDVDPRSLVGESWRAVLASVMAGGVGFAGAHLAGQGAAGIVVGGGSAAMVFALAMLLMDRALTARVVRMLRFAMREAAHPVRAEAAAS
jgi:O-antigen/teichoic acid export membrane protein